MTAAPGGEARALHEISLDFLLAPIRPFLEDPEVSEVLINGAADVRVERRGTLHRTDARFTSEDDLLAAMRNVAQFVGRRIAPDTARLDARLPDGSRVHMVLPPVSHQGVCVAIRKFSRVRLGLDDLVSSGSLTEETREFLELAVLCERNLLVAGGTGSGKTTLLNVLSSLIPGEKRVLVLEDTSELQLSGDHVLRFETRPPDRHGRGAVTIRDLVHSCLRMRPDRIVVGECRGGEALDLVQAMTSGHGGSMTTLHADSAEDALRRLETMALMAGLDLPLAPLRAQIASAVGICVQVGRVSGRRRVLAVAEVRGLDDLGRYVVEPLYEFRQSGRAADGQVEGQLQRTGGRAAFAALVRLRGLEERVKLTRGLFEGW